MLADKVLRRSLLFSVIVHTIFIFSYNPLRILRNATKPNEIEITYYRKTTAILPQALLGNKEKIAKPVLATGQKIDKIYKQPALTSKKIQLSKALSTEKIHIAKIPITQDKMLIFHDSKDLSNNPSYLKYHNIVRSKIERMANSSKPYNFNIGEVHLMFTILNSGDLKNVDLIDKNSVADSVLRQCALDSVYAASPFPPFTSEMKEDHLTLQVTISFEK